LLNINRSLISNSTSFGAAFESALNTSCKPFNRS
jgi:hypothetical protein